MIAGRMLHRDSAGHGGLLENGGVQWMTAGRGVIHSEIPQQEDGVMEGFQLWLNLPARDKMANSPEADGVVIDAAADAKVLLIAGQPLKEPIAQYGPFVMNTQQEIYQALSDMRDGRLGEVTV